MLKSRLIHICGLVLLSTLLASCKTVTPPPQPVAASPEKKACIKRCSTQQTRCERQYEKLYQQCKINAKQQAKQHYEIYVQARKNAQKKIDKTRNDFLDLGHCTQQLTCERPAKACYSTCVAS